LNTAQVPFVSTAKISDEESMTYVDVNNYQGGCLVMEHLLSLGHKKVAFVGKPTLQSSLDRLNGYKTTLENHGLSWDPEHILITNTSSFESGHDYTMRLIQGKNKPTAIFFANDVMAIGAIHAINECGLRVPEDISVVGFDDIAMAKYVTPPLTTVRQPAFEKGVHAARLLIQCLEKELAPQSKILDVELIVRGSTAAAR
jgi:DNA-binding LacI/PurR family transcriptional regulator